MNKPDTRSPKHTQNLSRDAERSELQPVRTLSRKGDSPAAMGGTSVGGPRRRSSDDKQSHDLQKFECTSEQISSNCEQVHTNCSILRGAPSLIQARTHPSLVRLAFGKDYPMQLFSGIAARSSLRGDGEKKQQLYSREISIFCNSVRTGQSISDLS